MMRRHAVTLIELVLVILMIGVIIGFAFPHLEVVTKGGALMESAERLRSRIIMSHAESMQTGLRYRITFPGTPDPNDKFAEKEIDVPFETLQPEVTRQSDPIENAEEYGGFDGKWKDLPILQSGVRCVAVRPGRPQCDIRTDSELAGPSITEDRAEFVPLTLYPDGQADEVTFVLTDLPFDLEEPRRQHRTRILKVFVDGRTGQPSIQRALTNNEVEVFQDRGLQVSVLRDFIRPEEITEQDIEDRFWETHWHKGGSVTVGRRGGGR